jgi:hypothetical protein
MHMGVADMVTLSEGGEAVLRSTLSFGEDLAREKRRIRSPIPSAESFIEFCNVLATSPKEETLQRMLERHVGYLTGIYGTRDNTDLAVLFKPPVGTGLIADFAVLQSFQGGSTIHLIEIETSHEKLFTKALTPARRYQTALGQTVAWQQYAERHREHLIDDLVTRACSCPLFGEETEGSRGV